MFHSQALGNRMHELLNEEGADRFTIIHQVKDEGKKRELKLEEDEEDFLDEGEHISNPWNEKFHVKFIAFTLLY